MTEKINLKELNAEVGDWVDIDEIIENARKKGYQADYENLESWTSGFIARATISKGKAEITLLIEGSDMGHIVLNVKGDYTW
jgi:hypothetical protein